jgi:threonine/homoserine/homoserine lactone efflux protein
MIEFIMVTNFLAFLGVSLVVIVTPGPDTALTIRNTLFGGRSAGIATAGGVVAGQAIWALATSLGIVALIVASKPLFLVIKYAGAAYLVLLGLQALRAALRPARGHKFTTGARRQRRLASGGALRQGLVSNLGNPKMAVFFASLLPQFVAAEGADFQSLTVLGLVFCAMTFIWLTACALLVAKAGEVLRPRLKRAIEGLTGAVLIALGLRLAVERG